MSNGNGRVPLDWKALGTVLTFCGLVFTAGGGWVRLSAQERETESVKTMQQADHDALVNATSDISDMREDMADLKTDVKEIQARQMDQTIVLKEILREIRTP